MARDGGKKLILMSLGTAITGTFWLRLPEKAISDLNDDGSKVDGKSLKEMSGQEFAHFFWRTAFEAFGGREEFVVVMAVGAREGALEGLAVPENFVPVEVVPQLEVLPICSAFVTHGGMGSMMESIICRVPVAVVPVFGDQPDNADSAQRSGIGIGFRYPLKTLSAETLGNAVVELLDPSPCNKYRAALKSTAEKMEAMGGADKAIELIRSVATAEKMEAMGGA